MFKKRRLKKVAKRCGLSWPAFYGYAMKVKRFRKVFRPRESAALKEVEG